jgi:histidine triad (HIT) family protein
MENCIFCNIIAKKSDSHIVYEDQRNLVILDKAMDIDYHMLAIPKKHVKNILDCDNEQLADLISIVKKISNHCVNSLDFDGVNILSAANEAAGQSINHFHIHIIPRKNGDNIDAWPSFPGSKIDLLEAFNLLKQ